MNGAKKSGGFSLTELMVAMVIGLIIMAGASMILVNSKKNYTVQDSLARLQENARFAMQFITKDLRMVGYYGCADDISQVHNQLNMSGANSPFFQIQYPIEGLDNYNGTSTWKPSGSDYDIEPKDDTDAFAMRFLDPNDSVEILDEMPNQSASMKVNPNSGLSEGEVVMITDCSSADIFQITNFNTTGGFDHVVHNTGGTQSPGNSNDNNPHKLSKAYSPPGAKILRFYSVIYYVAERDDGMPVLRKKYLLTNSSGSTVPVTQELVEGIEDMQVLYGEDTTGDKTPDVYRTATSVSNWSNVITARVGILARTVANTDSGSKDHGQLQDTRTHDIDGDGVADVTDAADGYERRVFRATVMMRNLK